MMGGMMTGELAREFLVLNGKSLQKLRIMVF
jgi:hypothetical protein